MEHKEWILAETSSYKYTPYVPLKFLLENTISSKTRSSLILTHLYKIFSSDEDEAPQRRRSTRIRRPVVEIEKDENQENSKPPKEKVSKPQTKSRTQSPARRKPKRKRKEKRPKPKADPGIRDFDT